MNAPRSTKSLSTLNINDSRRKELPLFVPHFCWKRMERMTEYHNNTIHQWNSIDSNVEKSELINMFFYKRNHSWLSFPSHFVFSRQTNMTIWKFIRKFKQQKPFAQWKLNNCFVSHCNIFYNLIYVQKMHNIIYIILFFFLHILQLCSHIYCIAMRKIQLLVFFFLLFNVCCHFWRRSRRRLKYDK